MIIGLTGGFASGTSEAAAYLKQKYGFAILVFSDVLRQEAKKRHIEPTRENLQQLGIKLREESGDDAIIALKLITLIKGNAAVDGVRNPSEIKALRRAADFFLIGIEASPIVRFRRLAMRARGGDPLSYEEFLTLDTKELDGDVAAFAIRKCLTMTDATIRNESPLEQFFKAIDDALQPNSKSH